MTKDTYQLFARAKQLKKAGIKYIWVANGEVLIRANDEAKVTKIISAQQVTELEMNHALITADKRSSNKTKPRTRTQTKIKPPPKKPVSSIATTDDEEFTDAESND